VRTNSLLNDLAANCVMTLKTKLICCFRHLRSLVQLGVKVISEARS